MRVIRISLHNGSTISRNVWDNFDLASTMRSAAHSGILDFSGTLCIPYGSIAYAELVEEAEAPRACPECSAELKLGSEIEAKEGRCDWIDDNRLMYCPNEDCEHITGYQP